MGEEAQVRAGITNEGRVGGDRWAATHEGWSICHVRGHPMSRSTRPLWHLALALWGRRGGGEGVVAGEEEGGGGRRGRGGECRDEEVEEKK